MKFTVSSLTLTSQKIIKNEEKSRFQLSREEEEKLQRL